jgi:hypothetical protein
MQIFALVGFAGGAPAAIVAEASNIMVSRAKPASNFLTTRQPFIRALLSDELLHNKD